MFGLVDIQDTLPNLHGLEIFNKIFKRPHSTFAETRGSPVHNVWVLPGHVIVSLDEGHKVLAFDLLPKQKPWPEVLDFMNANNERRKRSHAQSVLDVFCNGSSPLYLFIVLKNAEICVWKFTYQDYEWHFVNKFNLSIGKNIQIMAICYDRKSKTLFWCERRTTTQCFVCRATISTETEKEILLHKSDILRNCPPMQLYQVGPCGVLLRPTANSPTGLTIYWTAAANRVQLHMWNHLNSGAIAFSTSSDFQSLVTESISLWINQSPGNPTAIAFCTHPVTQELMILESNYNVYSTKIDADGKPSFRKLCTLAQNKLGELNQRKTYKILAFKKFLALLTESNELLVFETYKGMHMWTSDLQKNERPNIWVSQGDIPQLGVWGTSYFQVLVSETVMKQAENMLKLKASEGQNLSPQPQRKVSKEYTLHLTFKGNHGKKGKETYVVVDQEGENSIQGSGIKEENSATRSDKKTSDLLLLVSDFLNDWDTKNLSLEVCLWLLDDRKSKVENNDLHFRTKDEFRQIYTMIDNPCIFLALLHQNRKYRVAVAELMKEYVENKENGQSKNIDSTLFSLIQRYSALSEDISKILVNSDTNDHKFSPVPSPFNVKFRHQLTNESLSKQEIYEIIESSAEVFPQEFIRVLVSVLNLEKETDIDFIEDDAGMSKIQEILWQNILRKDTNSFEIICNCLWKAAPNLLVRFVKEARAVTTVSETSVYLHLARRQSLVSMADISQRAVDSLPYNVCSEEISREQVVILVKLLTLSESTECIVSACTLYLRRKMFAEAVSLLESFAFSPELHARLFFMILTALIENRAVSSFSEHLRNNMPSKFTVMELSRLLQNCEGNTPSGDAFTTGDRTILFGHFEPMLQVLLEREGTEM